MLDKNLINLTVDLLAEEILFESYGLDICSLEVHRDKLVKSVAYREYSLKECEYDAVQLSIFANRYCQNINCITVTQNT